jgi:RNA-binding protein YlmH
MSYLVEWIQITDMSGRIIHRNFLKPNRKDEIPVSLSGQVIVVSLFWNGGTKTEKVFVY